VERHRRAAHSASGDGWAVDPTASTVAAFLHRIGAVANGVESSGCGGEAGGEGQEMAAT